MARLYKFRSGWENENLAKYLLSRIAFIAEPVSVSDDLGSDIYCTLFETKKIGKEKLIFPKSTIAIQIKSNFDVVNVDPSIDYLNKLELPYFVGVVDRSDLSISIYSGENLSWMFSYVGKIESLKIRLVEKIDNRIIPTEPRRGKYTIQFQFVCKFNANSSASELEEITRIMLSSANISFGNISTRRNKEYLFESSDNHIHILAGKDSATTYQINFIKRLAECFRNIHWILVNNQNLSDSLLKEFKIYERVYLGFIEQGIVGKNEPSFLIEIYTKLRDIIDKHLSH